MSVTVFSPAKVNLFLAITGRRPDGFHNLVSVAAPLDFGDELTAEATDGGNPGSGRFRLECTNPAVPVDGRNLILRAAAAFAAATGWTGGARFQLRKRIPMAAGLGGGSSNAVAALRALNELAGGLAGEPLLAGLAAELGSDCPLFLAGAPVVMRGRGERVERLAAAAAGRLRGQIVLLFRPGFGVSTEWAYRRLAAQAATAPASPYLAEEAAERRLAAWVAGGGPAGDLLCNSLEPIVGAKYLALPVLLGLLRRESGAEVQMSGSGSACFALAADEGVAAVLAARVRECWGTAAFLQRARLL